jgi:alpha-tubulin suppressor-like RCC1 family protein
MRKRRIMNVIFIYLILISVFTLREQYVEGRKIQGEKDNQLVSLNEQEITEEVTKRYRSLFLENKGQIGNEEILFYGSLPMGKIAFGESKVLLWMKGMNDIVTLSFVGAQKVLPIGLDEQITRSNYFLGGRGTYTNVRSFEAIIYYDLWEGIDLYYKATSKGIKYEFRVAPGANPEDICVKSEGQEQIIFGKDSLIILKGKERFIDEGLKVYQENAEIDAKFVEKGRNAFGFQIRKYDENKPLIIDPLLYSTFVGGSSYDYGHSIAVDMEGNIYVTGNTRSSDFPTTENAYNRTHGDGLDCFVFKLSADGSTLLYSTFIGGSSYDSGQSIAVDMEGNIYVTGNTESGDFPTTANAYNRTHGDGFDCFVFKLSADGSTLLYSTFVGGSSHDSGYSIAVDMEGNTYVTGNTQSGDFPTTENAYNRTFGGGYIDCFVFKLAANGSTMLYSTFIGGNDWDMGRSITLDNQGNAYITGETVSVNFPTSINAYNNTHGGESDCFICKLSADGSTLLYSTFIGGNDEDYGISITLDSQGNMYLTGRTSSPNFPTTKNVYNRTHSGYYGDCFVCKLSADGSYLHYSTFVGGNEWDMGRSIVIDEEDNTYVCGTTKSKNFPTSINAYNNTHGGEYDCFVFKLSVDGSTLLYSTFVGGSSSESGYSIAIDMEGNAYVTGNTQSGDFPTTANAYNRTFGGGYNDCFVFKLLIEDATGGFGIPIIKTINLVFISLSSIVIMPIIIQHRKRKR